MTHYKRWLALLLAAALVLGSVGCTKQGSQTASETAQFGGTDGLAETGETVTEAGKQTDGTAIIGEDGQVVSLDTGYAEPAPADDTDRESLEGIVEMLAGDTYSSAELENMSDDELNQLITDMLEQGS